MESDFLLSIWSLSRQRPGARRSLVVSHKNAAELPPERTLRVGCIMESLVPE
jgi:hypothetical protein